MNTWDNLTESPWVSAVYAYLESVNIDTDVAAYNNPSTAPIENVRAVLDFFRVPRTSHLGEAFTRRVASNLFEYFNRNSWAAFERTSTDLQFNYIHQWRHGDVSDSDVPDTRRTAIDICVSPSPLVETNDEYVNALSEWLSWIWPYLEGSVDCVDGDPSEGVRSRIYAYLCSYGEIEIHQPIASVAFKHYVV